jgi:hypothetical protein
LRGEAKFQKSGIATMTDDHSRLVDLGCRFESGLRGARDSVSATARRDRAIGDVEDRHWSFVATEELLDQPSARA